MVNLDLKPSPLVTIMPQEGVLAPFGKILVHFKFSPRYMKSTEGWKNEEKAPPRQDYAFFMQILSALEVSKDKDNSMFFVY